MEQLDTPQDVKDRIKSMSADQKIDFVERLQQKIEEIDQKQEEADDYYIDAEGNKQPNLLGGITGKEIAEAQKLEKMRDMALDSLGNEEYMR